jgi:hypothetical protein
VRVNEGAVVIARYLVVTAGIGIRRRPRDARGSTRGSFRRIVIFEGDRGKLSPLSVTCLVSARTVTSRRCRPNPNWAVGDRPARPRASASGD